MVEGNSCGEISGHTKVSGYLYRVFIDGFLNVSTCYSASMPFLSDSSGHSGQ